jgi:2-dehydropantoate 2-reductase
MSAPDEPSPLRALIVGAGAVGQVYAHHLARGGAAVSFLVKPARAAELARPLTLYPLNRARRERTRPVSFAGFGVLTDPAAVARERWDQVYLTVSSTALRAGDWFARLALGVGHATVVLLQSGPDDRRFVGQRLPVEQVVQGVITLISYRAPLPGETRFPRPGVAYWFPPLAPSPMSGARREPVLAALRAGGLPARGHRNIGAVSDFPTALLMPLMAALEQAGWSFRTVRQPGRLALAARAAREALRVMAHRDRRPAPWPLRFVNRPLAVRLALAVAPRLMPLDIETYLRVHFTKVSDQTRDFLRTYLTLGRAAGLPTGALAQLEPGA